MADAGAITPPTPPQTGAPLPGTPANTPDLVPVIDVGGSENIDPAAKPGQAGSGERPIFLGAGGPVTTHPIPGDDQVRRDFTASRALAQAGDPIKALEGWVREGAPSKPTTETPGTPEQTIIPGLGPDNDQPVGRKLVGSAAALQAESDEEAGNELDLSSTLAPLGRAAVDIGVGATEAPLAVLRGMLGGAAQMGETGLSVRNAIDGVLPRWLQQVTNVLNKTMPAAAALEGATHGAEMLHDLVPEPSTTTGGLVEGVSQFGTGLLAGGPTAKAIGLTGLGAKLFADVVAGATAMDPKAPRLSNLIDDVAPNFLTEWLKAKPDQDNALMGRLKSGLEFAGLGALFEGLRAGLSAVKRAAVPKTGFGRESNLGTTNSWATGQKPPTPTPTGEAPEGVLPPEWTQPLVEVTPRTQGAAETVLEQQAGMGGPPVPEHTGAPVRANSLSDSGPYRVERVGQHAGGELPLHGLYLTSSTGNTYPESGAGKQRYIARPMNPLRVEPGVASKKLNFSAGTEAARKLLGDAEVDRLLNLSESDAIAEAERRSISVPSDRRVSQRLTEILGADAARGAGYDSIIMDHPTSHGEPPEMVVLDRSILSPADSSASLSPAEIADYMEGRTTVNPIRINLLRIGSGDDIRNILEQVARTIPEPEVVSNEATIRAADALGVSPSDFLAGYKGQSLNASETTAMRFVLDSSARQLIDYAKAAADPLANTDEARATFLKAFATHDALQKYYVNARAEAGRTLQAWSILSQTRPGYAKAVQQLTEQAGQDNVAQMAADIASLDNPLLVSRLVSASQRGTGRDTFLKGFYNVLLSNPRTVVKKLASDVSMAMWNLATSYGAEKFGSGAVAPGETAQLAYGYISSLKDGLRMAGKGLKAGESQFFQQFQTMDWMDKSRLSNLANGAPETLDEAARAGTSYLRAALPTSWIGAADDFAKYVNYRAYVRSLAFRDGITQGLDGPDLATHVAQTLDNIPDAIHQEALTNTLRSTFQEPLTGVLKQLQGIVDSNVPIAHTRYEIPVGRIIMPFVKTPANIARWTYNNSPLAAAFPSNTIRAELSAGGATRDLAMARMWMGSAVALTMADAALNNVITGAGPRDPQLQRAWRAAGNEPYSVQLPGHRPVSYNMVEPLGLMMGAVSDSFNIMKFAREDGRENVAASLMFGAGHAMLSKTYLQGIANVMDALNDPERSGDRVAQSIAMTFLSPQGIAAAAHASDPFIRYHRTLLENEESRLPIVSQSLPPARTLWGDPIPQKDAYLPFMPTDGFTAKMLSPWQLGPRAEDVQPIDRWIWENRSSFPRAASNKLGISKPEEFQNFEASPGMRPGISVQVHLDPQQFDRFQELAGNALKNPATHMGAKDTLNAFVDGTYVDRQAQSAWNEASPAVKALWVQRVVNGYRRAAQVQLRQDFPDLEETIREGASSRAQQLRGLPGP